MVSPFRRHQQHVRGIASGIATAHNTIAAAPERDRATPEGQEYAALCVLLDDNLRQMQDVQSVEARNPMKAEFAKAFSPWIEGVLAAGAEGRAAQDKILVQNLVWAIDYRDFAYALRLATHAIRFNLALPERFNRTLPCMLAEDIAELSLAQADLVSHDHLLAAMTLTEDADMPDQARAKLHKAIARSFFRRAEAFDPAADNAPAGGKAAYLDAALTHARRAFQLDHNVGVKSDIKSIERLIKDVSKPE